VAGVPARVKRNLFPDQDGAWREKTIRMMVTVMTIPIAGSSMMPVFPHQDTLIRVKMVKQAAGMTVPIFLVFIKD